MKRNIILKCQPILFLFQKDTRIWSESRVVEISRTFRQEKKGERKRERERERERERDRESVSIWHDITFVRLSVLLFVVAFERTSPAVYVCKDKHDDVSQIDVYFSLS